MDKILEYFVKNPWIEKEDGITRYHLRGRIKPTQNDKQMKHLLTEMKESGFVIDQHRGARTYWRITDDGLKFHQMQITLYTGDGKSQIFSEVIATLFLMEAHPEINWTDVVKRAIRISDENVWHDTSSFSASRGKSKM